MRDYQTKTNQGGLPDSITSTRFGSGEFNSIATELKTFVDNSGQTLATADGTGESTDQLGKAATLYSSCANFYVDSGIADAYILAHSGSIDSIHAYTHGMLVAFLVGNTNTGASTVNVSSLGVKSITRLNGVALSAGDLLANEYIMLRFDSANDRFEIQTYSGSRALEVLDGIEVGGNTSGDILTTDGVQTVSGKTFSQDGTLAITDTGGTGVEYPVFILAPNATTTSVLVGKSTTSGNIAKLNFNYVGDNNPANYVDLGIQAGGGSVRVYNEGYVETTDGNILVNMSDTTTAEAFKINMPSLTSTQSLYITMGVASSEYNQFQQSFLFIGASSVNNEYRFGLHSHDTDFRMNGYGNVGINATPEGSGGAKLNVGGEIQGTSLDINGSADISGDLQVGGTLTVVGSPITSAGAMVTNASGSPIFGTTSFDVSTNVTEGAWESVGPTGSGATNIFTAMDDIPSGADWVKCRVHHLGQGGAVSANLEGTVYAREGGSSASANIGTAVAWSYAFSDSSGNANAGTTVEFTAPLDSSLIFDINWSSDFTTDSISLYIVGYGYNE